MITGHVVLWTGLCGRVKSQLCSNSVTNVPHLGNHHQQTSQKGNKLKLQTKTDDLEVHENNNMNLKYMYGELSGHAIS